MTEKVLTFRQVAYAIAPHFDNVFALLDAATTIHEAMPQTQTITSPDGFATWDGYGWAYKHDALVNIALTNDSVIGELSDSRKIQGIKRLREITKCGLKAAKDAVEDPRVTDEVRRRSFW